MGVTLGHLVQPDLTMAVLTSHLVILTASLGLAPSQTCSGVGYFPHPSDCSQFFRCTDIWATGQYQQYAFTCAEGTVFDASISVCNWPSQVAGCGGDTSPSSTSTSELLTPPDTTTAAISSTYRPAAGSHFQCEKPGIVSDEENCNKFWLCKEESEGSGVLESLLYRCPTGYLFSSAVLRCRKEDDVTCLDSPETRNVNVIQLSWSESAPDVLLREGSVESELGLTPI